MSYSPQTEETGNEEVLLNLFPGTGNAEDNNHTSQSCNQVCVGHTPASWCDDRHHRKLAICSIICGLSCIGIKALIYSVKAEDTTDPEASVAFSRRARKFGIISIVTWVSILALTPMLMALVSYLLTLED